MPVVQIDWAKLIGKLGDVTGFYTLTHRQASLLLSLSEQLTWEKTFRDFGYDFSDWDTVQLEVADLQRWLMSPVDVTDLIGYIDEIEDLLKAMQTIGVTPCCDTIAPLAERKQSDEDYPDTPPAEWGDGEPIADSDDWMELVCGAAHKYVDLLKDTGDELEGLFIAGALVMGGIAGLLSLGAGAGILLAVSYSVAAGITTGLIEGMILGTFGDTVDDLEANRASITCAIVLGTATDLSDAIEDAVSALAWTLWFQWVDYESAWATMVDGYNSNGALEVSRRTDCDCPAQPQDGCLTGLLYNCGFENALGAEWALVSGPAFIRKTGSNAHDGTYGLGSSTSEQTIWFKQEFTSPGDYTRITVKFWSRATTGLKVYVDSVEVFNQNFVEIDTIWRFRDIDIDTSIDGGDLIEIRPRLHSTWSVDSFNVVLSSP